ncbi:MAG: ankyrin repeat domain-containing protein [Candidatus Eisenbacteria bacterium]|nr:ankyrin repeat domain-containing protein [Candidatus Eisenbacteria bacterium]
MSAQSADDPLRAFIVAACVPRDASHASGDLAEAEVILAAHPEAATADIHAAAILGDEAAVRRWIARDPAHATAKGGPYGWDALTHLCFSRYLRIDRARSDGFVRAAAALLDAGASANTGWWEPDHRPEPEWEPALYGAAGVAHHAPLTRLLLAGGANPTDVEVVYHSPETRDNAAMEALVESGKLREEDLTLMLIRKHDWHDTAGAQYLLEHGANPNYTWRHGLTALHHALARDNALRMFELLLDHGADPRIVAGGLTGVARSAREGRSDVLDLFERRGVAVDLAGVDALIAACARGDAARGRAIAGREPRVADALLAMGGDLLARFAGTCNPAGVGALLDLGVSASAPFAEGDAYFGEPGGSLAIHVAAWRACPDVVKLLIERGSPVDAPDPRGHTPLVLAIRACVDSYWTEIATTDSIRLLLAAGAPADGITLPTGRADVDEVLREHGGRR